MLAIDSFKPILKTLAATGYIKPMLEELSPRAETKNKAFRIFTIFVLVIYDLQHSIFIIQASGNMDLIVASLFTLIVTINVTFKLYTLFVKTNRLEKLRDNAINHPIFKAYTNKDEEFLVENTSKMHLLTKVIKRAVLINTAFWFTVPFIERWSDENAIIPSYFPFDTTHFFGYACGTIYDASIMFWVGYAHMTCNCFIAALYSQACTQIRIIRYRLENMIGDDDVEEISEHIYSDARDSEIERNYFHCVRRYQKVQWFTQEVESIFSNATLVQLVASSGIICMVVYKMSGLKTIMCAEFVYQNIYLSCLLVELFIYCYYGTLVYSESILLNDSIYQSNWVTLSPKFRRMIIISMVRWFKPIQPIAAGLIPLSLNTFIKVVRLAYSIYTVLTESKAS